MDELYYCGFNGFRQVPSQHDKQTLTTLVAQFRRSKTVLDVAICWNYLVVAESDALIKYGLVNGKNGQFRLPLPPGAKQVVQVSATSRHLLAITDLGECWAHEENKGWRRVFVGAERPEASKDDSLIDLIGDLASEKERQSEVRLTKASCGDAHNIGLDVDGCAYSLPSPLDFHPFPGGGDGTTHRVTDVVCGKEHCLLLTEHGQVFSWGGGSRGQLGHGNLCSEEKPRLVMALDGMRIRKVAAGGWHSACVSQHDDLYMFGWNESGQLAQPTNLTKPAECFSAVEKLFVACCTMQPDDAVVPREDAELDCEVYHKNNDDAASAVNAISTTNPNIDGFHTEQRRESSTLDLSFEKDAGTNCYGATIACNGDQMDVVTVQSLPMLVSLPEPEACIVDVGCGSRHTVVLTRTNQLWAFGWNKYGQLGLGHNRTCDVPEKMSLPKGVKSIKMLKCGDWGTAILACSQK